VFIEHENGFSKVEKKIEEIMLIIDHWIIDIKQYLNLKEMEKS
jgi:hypothetical protein